MTSLQDAILSTFIEQKTRQLKDTDVSLALSKQGVTCNPEDIRRQVQSLSPALFQLIYNTDDTFIIRLEPTLEICEQFLTSRCQTSGKTCNKLHICRYFGHCSKTDCGYPHDFNKGYNQKIVTQHRCQHINSLLLVKLLQLSKSPSKPPADRQFRGGRKGIRRRPVHQRLERDFSTQKDELDRQVDVSFPSSSQDKQIDMEHIELLLLTLRSINVKGRFDEKETEYCGLATIQLERMNDVEELLRSPVINYRDIDIKFKRTKQIIDKTSFLLKLPIDGEEDKVDPFRLELYTGTLVEKNSIDTTSDLSTDSEQIIWVQCKCEIDFDKARQNNITRPQPSDKDISLIQIYECDALRIHRNNASQSINEDDLKVIFHSVWREIFAYHFPAPNHAEVQFMNVNVFKQWMSTVDVMKKKFDVTIIAIIDSVDENSIDTRSNVSLDHENRARQTTINLREHRALIAAHPKFKFEYKDFIRRELGGDVNVHDNKATYTGTFPPNAHGSSDAVVLGNKTQDFMRTFQHQTFKQLDETQLQILRRHSATIAYTRIKDRDYLVATKLHDMPALEQQLSSNRNVTVNPTWNDTEQKSPTFSPTTICFVIPAEQTSVFSIETFVDRLQRHIRETFNVNLNCERLMSNNEKSKETNLNIRMKITGQMIDAEKAMQDVNRLFDCFCRKKFADGNWTRIEEATQVINHYFQLADMICVCERITPTEVSVSYFDIRSPQFGIDEGKIEELIKDRFRSASIPLTEPLSSSKLTKDWANLEEKLRQCDDYRKKICFTKESNTIKLFGSPELVKEFRQKFERVKLKYELRPCKLTLSTRQLNYLEQVAKADMNKLEKECKSNGCDVSITRLRQHCEFLAPMEMHSVIQDKLQALAQIQEVSFDILEPGFEVLVSEEPKRLIGLVKWKCFLEKTIVTHRDHIPIPNARAADLLDRMKKPTATTASANSVASVTIGHSTVTISIGDLSAQAVDAIVLCSSSQILCKTMVHRAGAQVQQKYAALASSNNFPNSTSGGSLPCKRIFFVPWMPASRSVADVKPALSSLITTVFTQAEAEGCKSIAFPAIGCGQLNFDSAVIAKCILHEIRDKLKALKSKMNISFVLLAEQQTVYETFVKCLNDLEFIDLAISHKVPMTKKNDRSSIPFDRKRVTITLISSSENYLLKCREDIFNLARSSSLTSCTNQQEMLDWPQTAIYKYYDYCLKLRVIPTLDLEKNTLELAGPKDAVREADRYFYQLAAEISNEQRIHAVSQGVIWSVELTPNSDTWEQYSYKLNGAIEDAHSRGHSQVHLENEKGEKCQMIFSKMEERGLSQTRRIRRELVDSTLPKTWKISSQNCIRIPLDSTSAEYQQVLGQFHITMLGKYSRIIKIERIQNERWYKQYAAHRDDFRKRYSQDNERLLFHGCRTTSADEIIKQCFNRSFAGVNGVLYGHGVYFHAQALYSHQYAYANDVGERTMFLTRVLIGKTCKGDEKMKVVPTGYDTTTDGEHIFVVYHDAGAYPDHLITYK